MEARRLAWALGKKLCDHDRQRLATCRRRLAKLSRVGQLAYLASLLDWASRLGSSSSFVLLPLEVLQSISQGNCIVTVSH